LPGVAAEENVLAVAAVCGKKRPVALLKRHRLEDGIPKEEEEKPRE